MQRIVKPRDGADGVAKRGVNGHIADTFPVDIHDAAIAEAFDILGPGEGAAFVCDDIFRAHARILRFINRPR